MATQDSTVASVDILMERQNGEKREIILGSPASTNFAVSLSLFLPCKNF